MVDLDRAADEAMEEIARMRAELLDQVAPVLELPAPDVVLDLASRRGDDRGLAGHIHQMCALHRANYAQGTKVKHLYLVDAFINEAERENPLAVYSIARSMFELSAFTHEVQARLSQATRACTAQTWKPMAEKFFGVIVRARFATTNPEFREALLDQGISPKRLEPLNVMECIKGLATEPGQETALERYGVLCDYVHHNLGSSAVSNSGAGVADHARSARGGSMTSDGPMTIVRYEYPAQGHMHRVLNGTAPGFLRDAAACIRWMNATPETPFSPQLLTDLWGDSLGFPVIKESGPA